MNQEILNNYPVTEEQYIQMLEDYNHAYRNGLEVTKLGRVAISDDNYDTLTEDFRLQFPDSPWFDAVEAEEEIDGADNVIHKRPMLSTEKAYSYEELKKWVARIEKAATEINEQSDLVFRVTPKLDGLAGNDEDNVFATRGNGNRGSKITYAFERGVVPIGGRNQGLGEIIIQQSYFEKELKENFTHPRNVAVGIIKADTLKDHSKKALEDKAVHFVPYSQLNNWEGSSKELLDDIETISKNIEDNTDYLMDGLVVEVKNEKVKNHMGATNHHHRWQIALKKKGEKAQPTVTDIILQIGRTGVGTPVLCIEPVLLSGAVIRRVTAHNMGFIKKNNIGIGSIIEIIRSGEVIPKVEAVIQSSPEAHHFHSCPSCNSDMVWDDEEVFLRCENKIDCKSQIKGQLVHFFETLDNCDGFGKKTIESLVEQGVNEISEVYSLTSDDFERYGFGPGISKNLENALLDSRKNSVEDWRLLAAFGIKNLGRGDSKKLLKIHKLDTLGDVTQEEILLIPGFGQKTSHSICNEIKERWPAIKAIIDLGFNIEFSKTKDDFENIDSPINNKNILFTGSFTKTNPQTGKAYKRPEIEKIVSELGAHAQSQISQNTDILVYGEKAGSKLKKANDINEKKKGNITILSEEEFFETYHSYFS